MTAYVLTGVIGSDVRKSLTPCLHDFWRREHGLAGACAAMSVSAPDLAGALAALPKLGFRGVNVTIPHKETVIPLLDSCSSLARRLGAVNTVHFGQDGRSHGDNTDGAGFMAHLRDNFPDLSLADMPVVLVGAGGAARALAVALSEAGARLRIVNRTIERARKMAGELGIPACCHRLDEVDAALAGARLAVNASSAGMHDINPLSLDPGLMGAEAIVCDIVYIPRRTALLRRAGDAGLRTLDGLGMLVHQAVPGFAAWSGVTPRVDDRLHHCLAQREEGQP